MVSSSSLAVVVYVLLACYCTTAVHEDHQAAAATAMWAKAVNSSFLWGPYRSNLYFGIRPRLPNGILTGLAWANVDDYEKFKNLRHTCEHGDNMAAYGWTEYDGRSGGKQTIKDREMGVDINTMFVKSMNGERFDGGWTAKISGSARERQNTTTAVFFYLAAEPGSEINMNSPFDASGVEGAVHFSGHMPVIGPFDITIIDKDHSRYAPVQKRSGEIEYTSRSLYAAQDLPDNLIWAGKDAIFGLVSSTPGMRMLASGENPNMAPVELYTLPSAAKENSNFHVIQKRFQGDFEFAVTFRPASVKTESESSNTHGISNSLEPNEISEKNLSKSFDDRFLKLFKFSAPYNGPHYIRFAKEALSNLLGGVSYFHGHQLVDRSKGLEEEDDEGYWHDASELSRDDQSAVEEGPFELFTSVPSRPFFPRGFYWDEGFHLIPIALWDADLCLEIIKSWFNLADADGWIAREQILGAEARSKVPSEFQVQRPSYANPPTLILALSFLFQNSEYTKSVMDEHLAFQHADGNAPRFISSFQERLPYSSEEAAAARQRLIEIYPILQRHYDWFRRTQTGDIKGYEREAPFKTEAYRWRGRTPNHCLPSGLDDYPRAEIPHPGELHIDLMSWMWYFSDRMSFFATILKRSKEAEKYGAQRDAINQNINALLWSNDNGCYCDATVDDYDQHVLVCHKGYLSIFPFLVGILSGDDPKLKHILDLIEDPNELFSPYGLRSLSKRDDFYGQGENYWRGPVWIQVNYMALSSLHKLSKSNSVHQAQASRIYKSLREAILNNVYSQWKQTGFTWEQYDAESGHGKGSHPFDGWTGACTLAIMNESYLL